MNNIFVKTAIVMAVFLPTFAHAGPILRTGDSISIDASQTLKGDFYGFAPTVTVSGAAENDVYIGGGTVTVNAPVAEDLTIAGGVVQIHGDVADDLRVVGGEVTLAKAVKGDVVVLGGMLTILSTASIEGDVLFYGGELLVEGKVVGGVHGTADRVRINSEIGGDVSLTVQSAFTIGDNANILGSLQYESDVDLERAQNAVTVGDIRKIDMVQEEGMGIAKQFALRIVILLFAALTIFLTLRKYVVHVMATSLHAPGVSGLVGIGIFMLLPFVGVLLLVSVLGTLIGMMLLALYVFLCVGAVLMSGILCGVYLQKAILKKTELTFGTIVIGVVSLCLVAFVPVVGGLTILGLMLIVLGGAGTVLYQAIRS